MSFSKPVQLYFLCKSVLHCSLLAASDSFLTRLPYFRKREISHLEQRMKKGPNTQFTCVTRSLPIKTGKFTCLYPASNSRRINSTTRNEVPMLRVTSPAEFRLAYLQFANDFTCSVITDGLRLRVFLPNAKTGNFAC